MSIPTFDVPEHLPIPVDINGDGPVSGEEIDHVVCWCGKPDCEEWN